MSDPNANRAGYKETKVGWIPNEWDEKALGALTKEDKPIVYGIVQAGPDTPDGVPYIRSTDVGGSVVPTAGLLRTTKEIAKKYKRSVVQKDDLVFSLRGNIGATSKVPAELEGANLTQGTARLALKECALSDYVRYALAGYGVRRLVDSWAKGSTFREITIEDLRKVPVPHPSGPERRQIASILSTCDEAIEKTGALIDAKNRQKKALMQQLLTGKKRLPGFEGDGGRTEYRFFDLPSDWACPHVREVAQERSERNGDSDSHTVLACSKHLGFVESKTYFKKQVFSEDTSNYKVVRRGWFGFPSNHVEEGSIGLLSTHDSGIVSPIYCVFETSSRIVPDYLYAVFKSETFRHIFSVTTNASVDRRGSLRWDAFSSIRVPCPTVEEQRAIASVNEAAANEINILEKKLAALEQQKKSLMQKLLTGQVRVTV